MEMWKRDVDARRGVSWDGCGVMLPRLGDVDPRLGVSPLPAVRGEESITVWSPPIVMGVLQFGQCSEVPSHCEEVEAEKKE